MLVVFFGSDTTAVRTKALQYVAEAETAGTTIYRLEAETYETGALAAALGANSLFATPTLYVIDTPSTDAEFAATVLDSLPALAESTTTFVVIEGPLKATEKKQYTAHATTNEEITAAKSEAANPFALAEALAQRDKKTLWLLLQAARQRGSSDEEIIGLLWWQLKALRLAAVTQTAEAAGMKSFPYQKAQRALRNFKPGEIETLATTLLTLYHDGHAGTRDLTLGLEAWVLSV